ATDLDQLGADIEPDANVACPRKQRGERPRPAAEIDHPRARLEASQTHERIDDPLARLRREYVVIVRHPMTLPAPHLFLPLFLLGLRLILHRSTLRVCRPCPYHNVRRSTNNASRA